MTQEDCRSELVLAERQGLLAMTDRDALTAHLRACDSCRMVRLFGQAFDEPEAVRTDDAERLDAMLAAAERWRVQPRGLKRLPERKHKGKVVFLAAAITVTATAAAAAIALHTSVFLTPPLAETTATRAQYRQPGASKSEPATRAHDVNATPQGLPALPAVEPAREAAKVGAKTAKSTETRVRPELSAEQLLQRANLARRAGNTAEASQLFRTLQRLYPASREARLSEVVLGTLLLEQGNATAALEQLNRYLEVGSGQNLAAEALYGKGRALAQLGRSSEEQDVWRALLDRFPKSPYVSHARKRLGLSR